MSETHKDNAPPPYNRKEIKAETETREILYKNRGDLPPVSEGRKILVAYQNEPFTVEDIRELQQEGVFFRNADEEIRRIEDEAAKKTGREILFNIAHADRPDDGDDDENDNDKDGRIDKDEDKIEKCPLQWCTMQYDGYDDFVATPLKPHKLLWWVELPSD